MVNSVVDEYYINADRWKQILFNSTKIAVQTVKPSSQYLNDDIDFNKFTKIIKV